MSENEKALSQAGQAKPTQISAQPPAEPIKETFEAGRRERWALAATLALCVLTADTLLWYGPGLGVTLAVLGWYALALAYLGPGRLRSAESRFLLAVNLLLAATLALTSNWYFRLWNCGALALLLPVHAFALSGGGTRPWWRPSMLVERFLLLLRGLFGSLGAVRAALLGAERKGPARQTLALVRGALGALALVLVLLPVLLSADALFRAVTAEAVDFFRTHFLSALWRLLAGLALTPFVFGLLYRLRRPRALAAELPQVRAGGDRAVALVVLGTLDALYLLFLAVQSAGLFGGPEYLAARGLSYADWARSGFFQLVFVTALNLTVLMAALALTRREKGWRAVQLLATALAAESGLLLCSAAWRMTLYVDAYGLSFKRVMTYWGVAVMAVFWLAALGKIWRREFSFCRVAFLTAVLAWVCVSYVPVDYLVARDAVGRYLDGRDSVDITYLALDLSYDTLGPLAQVDGDLVLSRWENGTMWGITLEDAAAGRREAARRECGRWETWNLSAYLAGQGGVSAPDPGSPRP